MSTLEEEVEAKIFTRRGVGTRINRGVERLACADCKTLDEFPPPRPKLCLSHVRVPAFYLPFLEFQNQIVLFVGQLPPCQCRECQYSLHLCAEKAQWHCQDGKCPKSDHPFKSSIVNDTLSAVDHTPWYMTRVTTPSYGKSSPCVGYVLSKYFPDYNEPKLISTVQFRDVENGTVVPGQRQRCRALSVREPTKKNWSILQFHQPQYSRPHFF
ncbi:hypothetical protein J6590_081822 [Homalodisca vitripennis]|nr:hypothetical protein J6590_081822 [Homalodisca vitripennis]